MILASDLMKSFNGTKAVDGVSLRLHRGETFGLLGPNGAGKTTTIHMLTGALAPDSGTVVIDGKGGPDTSAAREKLGVAPQSLAIYEDLTAVENLTFFGKMYGLRGSSLRTRVDWCLEFVGLQARKDDPAKVYSGGMKRRLNLACALVHDPKVIFLDEPTVGVDPQSRNHIFDSVEQLKERGRTILYTTHYMEEAQRLCDRVAIMDHGTVLAEDTVGGLVDKHGGNSTVEAEFSQIPPAPEDLEGTLDGKTLRIDTDAPLKSVERLVGRGADLASLHIHRPDLQSVFLNLTGRSLRD